MDVSPGGGDDNVVVGHARSLTHVRKFFDRSGFHSIIECEDQEILLRRLTYSEWGESLSLRRQDSIVDDNYISSLRSYDLPSACFGIFLRGSLVGELNIWNIDHSEKRSCVISYWLGCSSRGKGVMTKSLKAFIDHIHDMRIKQVHAYVLKTNDKSNLLLNRLEFSSSELDAHYNVYTYSIDRTGHG